MNARLTIDGEEWPGDYHAAMVSGSGAKSGHLVVRSTTPCERELIVGWHRWIGAGPGHRFTLQHESGERVDGQVRWSAYTVSPWEDRGLFEYRIEFQVL